jgi:membrane-associated protease RseP (regulator of RpoE activity)
MASARTITVRREYGVFPFAVVSPASLHGYEHREATYVHHLKESGSAWKAGLQVGDLVVKINGEDCLAWTKAEVRKFTFTYSLSRAFTNVDEAYPSFASVSTHIARCLTPPPPHKHTHTHTHTRARIGLTAADAAAFTR